MYLSILIPVFNAENHIVNCLQSILDQEMPYEDYEVIIINDGSTDNSSLRINDFIKNHTNIVLINQTNQGNAATRNRLFELAKGEYVYCLDADDYLRPKGLRYVLDFSLKNQMDFVGFKSKQTQISDEESTPLEHLDYNGTISTGANYIINKPLPNVEVWWYLFKRKLLTDFEIGLDPITMADVLFTYRVVLGAKRMCILPIHVHWYFQSPTSVMRTQGSKAKHKIRLADSTYEMILALHDLIEHPNHYKLTLDNRATKDLILKRDYYAFFMVLKFLRFENNRQKIKDCINVMEQKSMYPFKNHVHIHKCPYFLEKIINSVINNKKLVFMLIRFSSIFNPKNKAF